ncbi:MAG: class I SAM-dependent methyltransferase [Corynebacterium sp.]|nr:class I SAM-dependent methyltransferase [Corynebacterium sp.]
MTNQAYEAINQFVTETSPSTEAMEAARAHAEEFGLRVPSVPVGQLITTLTAVAQGDKVQAVAITPVSSIVGLYLLEGLGKNGIVTCIDPEAEHQAHAKETFRKAGHSPARIRFLPSRPLDVMSRLANDSYQVIYADVAPLDLPAVVKAAWPLLAPHGTLVLPDVLLDATIADTSRTDRATAAAREADSYLQDLEGAQITRLPLGSGLTLATKLATS